MSNTRKAEPGGPLRQERYCSSAEFDRGLLGNVVAKRVGLLHLAEEREAIWYAQWRSWQEGGSAAFAAEMRERFPEEIATLSMQKAGIKPGQIYNARQVKQIREELGIAWEECPLKGERDSWIDDCLNELSSHGQTLSNDADSGTRREIEGELAKSQKHPNAYPARMFVEQCQKMAGALDETLVQLCLDPKPYNPHWPSHFPNLMASIGCLIEEQRLSAVQSLAPTIVAQTIGD